ncbi:natural killer cells antigen CD94-like [Pyxicephalus adspersus]|uniref:natural killer cells antigen CD94-like n=1 Tax=Pyxicephalus adspersus TaxID=30357 RepID=UPI003B5C09CF
METNAEYSLLNFPVGSSTLQLERPCERHSADLPLPHLKEKKDRPCLHKSIIFLTVTNILLSFAVCILVFKINHLLEAQNQCNVTLQDDSILHHLKKELCTSFPKDNLNETKFHQTDKEQYILTECHLCPTGWHLFRDNCYLFSSSQHETWNSSLMICNEMNSNLLTFENEEQMMFIKNYTKDNYWIGYHFHKNAGEWIWENCKFCMDFGNYSKTGSHEDKCMSKTKDHKYNSENCNSKLNWICQKKALIM